MEYLCSSSDYGFLISLQIALDSEGIETFLSDADRATAGITGAGNAGRLYLLNSEDLPAARQIVGSLTQGSPTKNRQARTEEPPRESPRWLVPLILLSAVLVIGFLLTNSA